MLHTGQCDSDLYSMDIGVVPHPIVPVSYQGRCLQPACNETSGHNIGGGSLVGSSQRQHLLSLLAEGRPELGTMIRVTLGKWKSAVSQTQC